MSDPVTVPVPKFKIDDWAKCKVHGRVVRVVTDAHQDCLQAIGCHGTTSASCLIPYLPTALEKQEVMNDWCVHGVVRLKLNMAEAIRKGWPTESYTYIPSFGPQKI